MMYNCVESEVSMTKAIDNQQPNYGNALSTAIIGGAAWGVGQYVFNKKPFVDGAGNIKDTFVKSMEDALIEIKDTKAIENLDFQKNLEKEINALKTKDALKDFLNNRKNEFMRISDDEIKLFSDDIAKVELDEGKDFVKRLFKSDGKYQKFYKDTLDSCYDSAGKLKQDPAKISQKNWEVLKEVINKARRNTALKAAGVFAGVCAACCCFFEWWGSRR